MRKWGYLLKLAITKKDHTVLLLSHISQDYGWFFKLMQQFDRITDELVHSLNEQERNFFENMLPIVLQQAILEWKEKAQLPRDLGEDKEKWIQCSLCGTPNRYIHYIVNRQTGREINVGSECVKEYAFNDGNTEYQRKEARKVRRLNVLNTELPGIKRKIDNWMIDLEKFDIWIPERISSNYKKIGKQITKIYEDFLDGKGSEKSVSILKQLLDDGQKEIEIFKEYEKQNKNKDFIMTQSIHRWIKGNQNNTSVQTAFNQLKKDGIITYKTAHRITEEGFMKKVILLMNEHLKEIGITIYEHDRIERVYRFEIDLLKECNFNISHQELLQYFGWKLFNEEPFIEINVKEFVKSGIIKDEKSMDVLLKSISKLLKKESIKLAGYDYDFNEVVMFNVKLKKHTVHNLKSFVSRYKTLSISNDHTLIRELNGEKGNTINLGSYQKSRDGYTPL